MIYSYTPSVAPGPYGEIVRFRNSDSDEAVELCEIGGFHYVYVPDAANLPDQPSSINWTQAQETVELLTNIRSASSLVRIINAQVVDKIRAKYSVDDEIKLLRTQSSPEFDEWSAYVEMCRDWGRTEKAKIGL